MKTQDTVQSVEPARRRDRAKVVLYLVAGLLVVFLIGAGWQFLRAERLQDELRTTQRELVFTRLEARLGAATLEARRGSFEIARQLASAFYAGLQEEIEATPDAARLHFTAVLDRRDDVITGLSRAQENTGVLLSDLYLRYRSGMAEMAAAERWPPGSVAPEAAAPAQPPS